MAGFNRVILSGNLGADPETRRLQSGDPVVSFRMATSKTWKDKDTGERKERTSWHSIVIFNPHLCETAEKYLKKGSRCLVEGELDTRKWQAQDGSDRYTTEVVLPRFGGSLVLMGDPSGRPAPSPDDYGTTRSREEQPQRNAYRDAKDGNVQTGGSFGRGPSSYSRDLDDEVSF